MEWMAEVRFSIWQGFLIAATFKPALEPSIRLPDGSLVSFLVGKAGGLNVIEISNAWSVTSPVP
jgi:hypothetical protein